MLPEYFNVLVDVDGVCADFMGMLFEVMDLPPFEYKEWDIFGKDPRLPMNRVRKAVDHPSFWADMAPHSDTIEAIAKGIKAANSARIKFDIDGQAYHAVFRPVFVTTPWHDVNMQADRVQWIDVYCSAILGGRSASRATVFASDKTLIPGCLIIEDKVDSVLEFLDVHPHARGLIIGDLDNHDHRYKHQDRFTRMSGPNMVEDLAGEIANRAIESVRVWRTSRGGTNV